MVSDDLVVFDNVLNQVFIITHINPDTQNYEEKDAIGDITPQVAR
jgi:anthranilate synthase component 1